LSYPLDHSDGDGLFPWVVFNAFVVVMLFVDLFVVNRRAHAVSAKEAAVWTAAWIAAAGAFNVFVYWSSGRRRPWNSWAGT